MMTGRPPGAGARQPDAACEQPDGAASRPAGDGWRACGPELSITAILVCSTCVAIGLYAGLGMAVAALVVWAALALALLRSLVPQAARPLAEPELWRGASRTSFIGYWRKRAMLTDATASMVSYDLELRPTLQHLLAARLAERHGMSLYADPEAARRILLPGAREGALWVWLDPRRPAETDQQRRGIPPRALAAILDRLERL